MNKFLNLINSFCGKLYSSIEDEGFVLLERIGNIDENIFDIAPLNIFFSDEIKQIVRIAVISIIFLFLIFYSLKIILFLYKDNISFSIFHFIFKIIFIGIVSTNSFEICREIIVINYDITNTIDTVLAGFENSEIKFSSLKQNVDTIEEFMEIQDKLNLKGLGESVICAFILGMIILLSVRYVIIIFCIIMSPICIIFSVNNKTRKVFVIWIKIFVFNLLLQNINKIMLFMAIISRKEKEVSGAIVIGIIILMYKINKKVGDIGFWKE